MTSVSQATEKQPGEYRDSTTRWLSAGVLTGIILTILMTPLQSASELREAGAMIGMPTYLGGVIQNLIMAIVFLVIFAGLLSGTSLRQYTNSFLAVVALGIGYGVVMWATYGSLIMPYWLRVVGVEGIPFPFFDLEFLVLHLVLGAFIGGIYYQTLNWFRQREHTDLNQTSPGQST